MKNHRVLLMLHFYEDLTILKYLGQII